VPLLPVETSTTTNAGAILGPENGETFRLELLYLGRPDDPHFQSQPLIEQLLSVETFLVLGLEPMMSTESSVLNHHVPDLPVRDERPHSNLKSVGDSAFVKPQVDAGFRVRGRFAFGRCPFQITPRDTPTPPGNAHHRRINIVHPGQDHVGDFA
jgi:hypothetical protein